MYIRLFYCRQVDWHEFNKNKSEYNEVTGLSFKTLKKNYHFTYQIACGSDL